MDDEVPVAIKGKDAIPAAIAQVTPVCTENLIRVDAVMESPKLAE